MTSLWRVGRDPRVCELMASYLRAGDGWGWVRRTSRFYLGHNEWELNPDRLLEIPEGEAVMILFESLPAQQDSGLFNGSEEYD